MILLARFGLMLLLLGWACAVEGRAATLVVHQLFSSHMVLQRDAADPVWGWAAPGATVTVKVYDQTGAVVQTKTAIAAVDGSWQATAGPFGLVANNAAYSMSVSDGTTSVTFTDILIGDVWLCTGQSNMAFSLNTIGVTNLAQEIADSANYPAIRCFTVPQVSSMTPQTNLSGSCSWLVAGPSTTGNFTATGYFTAREIYKQQHIPIGILCSAWAGSQIKSWLDPLFASWFGDLTQPVFDQSQTPGRDTISGPYNAMIQPLAPFRFKAVEWYQGEYNVSWPEQYSRLLPALMSQWRALFGQPNLPFIIIQLSSISGTQTRPVETGSWAELREAQLNTVLNDANARLVTTLDIGAGALHPIDKQDVGLRAARAAANLVCGQNVVSQGPVLRSTSVLGSSLICTFNNVGAGLMVGAKTLSPLSPAQPVSGGTLGNFALCGPNQVYYAANAVITGTNTVTVSSPSVSQPVSVRYAWGNNPSCNLYNTITDGSGTVVDGLPAGSLRNDPTYKLSVNWGSGSGSYALGSQVSITASNLAGQTFAYWSGDTDLLSSSTSPTALASVAQAYVSVLANYSITSAPSGLSASSQKGQVALSWNPLPAVHCNVKRSSTSGGTYTTIGSNLVDVTSYADTGAASGGRYYYVVSALNLLGEGPNSAEVSGSAFAATTNTWDANAYAAPGPSDGSGVWLTASNWCFSGTNIVANWTATAPDSALFGSGTPGLYTVDLGTNSLFASNVVFATSGYTLSNGTLTVRNQLLVNSNVTASVSSTLTNASIQVNDGGTLTLGGGGNLGTLFTGTGTLRLRAGTPTTYYSGGNPLMKLGSPTTGQGGLVIGDNCTFSPTAILGIGYGGAGLLVVSGSNAVFNVPSSHSIGRAGTFGRVVLQSGSINSGDLYIAKDGSSTGEVDVFGGTLSCTGVLYVNQGAGSGSGLLNITNGTVTTSSGGTLSFGSSTTSYTTGKGTLTLSGGCLYLGSGGMVRQGTNVFTPSIVLSGGTVGANADWSSSLAMTLTNYNGNITFKAADANSVAHNISLSGVLSGPGGLIKSGSGTLTLSGLNRYAGGTIVSNGSLTVSAGGALGSGNLAVSAGATCNLQSAGALASSAYVSLDGTMNLASGITNTVKRLYVGGVLQPAGVWNAARDGVHFAGAGTLVVSEGIQPGLGLNPQAGAMALSWPSWAADWGLYSTTNLAPPVVWTAVNNAKSTNNGQVTTTVQPGAVPQFFRLAKP